LNRPTRLHPRCLRTGLVVQQLNPRENAHNRRN